MARGLQEELKSEPSSMILMVLGSYFGAVTPEELIVFLETGMKREADLLMVPGDDPARTGGCPLCRHLFANE